MKKAIGIKMVNVRLICVGTLKESYLRDAVKEYEKRLGAYCSLTTLELKDCSKLLSASASALPISDKSYKIALCVEGEQLSSHGFSALISDAAVRGQGNVTLLIGGADGLPEEVKARCNRRLSFSMMTFPHQLMRVILLEQLYRAFNIAAGGKYHH